MNSYMRSPRSVTAQPMGMPLRILKFAMDFFARVMMAFWPVIWPSSCAAVSSSLTFWLASPRPMLTVTFCSLGTAIMFFQPKCFISAGTVSFRYFSCNRLFIAALVSPLLFLLIQSAAATLARAHLGAVRQNAVPNARVLAAIGADHHHIGNVDARFLLDDAALDVLARVGTGVALHDGDMLDHHRVFLGVDAEHAAALAGIAPGDYPHLVALANSDGAALRAFVCECHCLPNLRSQGNNLGKFLFAQFASHRAENARADRFARVINQDRGIVVEADVRAIAAPALFAHAHNHRFHYRALFYLAFRSGFLYRRGNDVAEARFQAHVAADRQNAHQLACAGIVRHRQPGPHLNHCSAPRSRLISALISSDALRCNTSFSRHRFSLEIGRDATMRTVSPGLAWRFSSCA